MLNVEKYKKEILAIRSKGGDFAISKGDPNLIRNCMEFECDNCAFGNDNICTSDRVDWLLSEYKETVKLSRLEYEILKFAINKNYEYIARDYDGELYVFMEKPYKSESFFWKTDGYYSTLEMSSVLFQFVKWEDAEPTLIKEVLNNCEVIENA